MMKFNNIFKYAVVALATGSLAGVTGCNYLDVVPPEQAGLNDAMKTHSAAMGFLYSCYGGLTDGYTTLFPNDYQSPFCGNNDEWVWPNDQEASYGASFAAAKNTQTTNLSNIKHVWGGMYHYIGQCLLFEEQLQTVGRDFEVTDTPEEEDEWLAETRFLKAFYHYRLLRLYGPIPLTFERIPMDTDASDYAGRSHFDYCVDYLANEFYQAAKILPAKRNSDYNGRATSVIAMACRAQLLLLAASDLYNGSFPFPEWENPSYETPGYGRKLVSSDPRSKAKWQRAYDATVEAIELAESAGERGLMREYEEEDNVTLASMNWIPVDFEDDAQKEEFIRKIMLNRYIHTTSQSDNPEILWAIPRTPDYLAAARMPVNIIKNAQNQFYPSSWGVVNPTLNTVYNFLCKDGQLPGEKRFGDDMFASDDMWFKPSTSNAEGHEDIINLMHNREPRFYAWICFDGGNYLNRLYDGQPFTVDLKKSAKQGYTPGSRNYPSTGLLAMKHVPPAASVSKELVFSSGIQTPTVFFRLTELYLNLAECAAELANPKYGDSEEKYKKIAMDYVNIIRDRAGVGELTDEQIDKSVYNPVTRRDETMTLIDWVRQERFIELWDEGHRYYDVRRWVAGPKYLGQNMILGLNGVIKDASIEEFNTPRVCNPNFTFGTRQYLYPVFINEVYKNPQMIQAPGF